MAIDKPRPAEGRGDGRQISAPHQDIHVLSIANRGFIHPRHPSRDGIASNDRVRDTRRFQGGDSALQTLAEYDWVVFTSANAVPIVAERLNALGKDTRAFGTTQIAAIGPATAEALRRAQLAMIAQPDWRSGPQYWAAYFLIGYPDGP